MEDYYFKKVRKTIVVYILRPRQKSIFLNKIKPIRLENRIISEEVIYEIKIAFKKIKETN